MIRLASTLAASLLLAAAIPAAAQEIGVERQPIELKNLEKGKQALDPAKAYIFIAAPNRINARFLKTPDAADVEAFEAEWREEYTRAREKYEKRLAAWEEEKARGREVKRPEEVNEETFSIGPLESRLMVAVGPQYVFDKGKTDAGEKFFHYLHEVEPGTYTFYGPLFFDPSQGAIGTCYCMGSWKFEAKAGEITSLGDFLTESWADDAAVKQANVFFVPDPDRVLKPTDWSVPATASGLPSVRADMRAAGKMNNFYRVSVLRSPPIPGVLRYERDTVIDVKAEIAAAEEAARAEAERAEAERLAAENAAAAVQAAAASGEEVGPGAE